MLSWMLQPTTTRPACVEDQRRIDLTAIEGELEALCRRKRVDLVGNVVAVGKVHWRAGADDEDARYELAVDLIHDCVRRRRVGAASSASVARRRDDDHITHGPAVTVQRHRLSMRQRVPDAAHRDNAEVADSHAGQVNRNAASAVEPRSHGGE